MDSKIYSEEEVYQASLEYFGGDELAAKVFVDKYALRDSDLNLVEKTPEDMHRRIAKEFARIEKNKFKNPYSEEEIFNFLDRFKRGVMQGSPMYGIGNPYQYVSIGNCFVLPSPLDSYLSILHTDTQITQISCRRGGVGWDVSMLRPNGMKVRNAARTTSGTIEFMKRFSNTIREVGQHGRRGASLQSISCYHPEIMNFIKVKQDLKEVTGSNISVQFTDEFMDAVINDKSINLRFPCTPEHAEKLGRKYPEYEEKANAKEIWKEFIHSAWLMAEPGCMFIDNVHKDSPGVPYGHKEVSSNPCLTGETLVYVADGRGSVSIGQLAEEGVDVDVFCLDENENISIRKMRNPRKTGERVPVFKITLDSGDVIRATENHKFKLKDGNYKEVKDLQKGDSLNLITKFESSIQKFITNKDRSQDYFWINNGKFSNNKAEHRIIAEYHLGRKLKKGEVVHHKDFNSKNNTPLNLEVLPKEEHDAIHRESMIGNKNPMCKAKIEWNEEKWNAYKKNMSLAVSGENNGRFSGISNKEIQEHAIKLTKKLNKRFSAIDWANYAKENNIIQQFSSYRTKNLGTIRELALWAAKECNLYGYDLDQRIMKTYKKAIAQDYVTYIENNEVLVEKTCENCKEKFKVSYFNREISFCGHICSLQKIAIKNKENDYKGIKNFYSNKAKITKEKQAKVFSDLKFNLGRQPTLKEWEMACIKEGIPFRLNTKNGFKNLSELQEASMVYNHKVVSVEIDGYEDVYNGTVDEFHNFFVGGWESKTADGKVKINYINNLNCGEQYLPPYASCRLILLNLYGYVKNKFTPEAYFDFDSFKNDVKMLQRLGDDLVDIEIECVDKIINKIKSDPEPEEIKRVGIELWENVKKTALLDRRTGCGITGLGDVVAALGMRYASEESIDFIEELQKTYALEAYRSSVEMAKELGAFPQFDPKLDKQSGFVQKIAEADPELFKEMQKYGRRNMVLLTIAPAGSVSCLTQTSSGLEPVFNLSYMRRKKGNPGDKGFRVDFTDENGDHWMHFDIYHKGFKDWMEVSGKTSVEESPYYKSTANDIDWINRVKLQSKLQKWIDNSISSTINLPKDTTEEMVSEIYLAAYKYGCKGVTIYREGCRDGVLVNTEPVSPEVVESKSNAIVKTKAPKRHKIMKADVYHPTAKGIRYYVAVGLMSDEPYEVFVGLNHNNEGDPIIPKSVSGGEIVKHARGKYDLIVEEETYPLTNGHSDPNADALTRMISTALRHGASIEFVVAQLEKTKGGDLQSFSRILARTLKKYIKDGSAVTGATCSECHQETMIYSDGCHLCQSCGASKCS